MVREASYVNDAKVIVKAEEVRHTPSSVASGMPLCGQVSLSWTVV